MTYLYMNRLGMWRKQSGPLNENQMHSAKIIITVNEVGVAACLKNDFGLVGPIKVEA